MEDGHVIPCYSTNFCAKGQQTGLNLTNLKLLKLGNAVEDFGNAMYWRGGAATPSSPASSTQAGLKPGASHVWSKDIAQCGTLGAQVWWKEAPTQHMNQKKKNKTTKREEVLLFWQGFNFLFWLLLAVWYHTLVSSSGSRQKSWNPTKSLGMFLWWPSLITKNSLNLAEVL